MRFTPGTRGSRCVQHGSARGTHRPSRAPPAIQRIHIFQRIAKLWLPWYVLAFVYRAPILDAHAGFRHDRMRPEFVGLLLQVASTFLATCMGMVAKVAGE